MSKPWVFLALRFLIGALFAFSGFQKILQPYQNFLAVIERFEIVDGAAAVMLARGLPWIEFFGGVFFFFGLWSRVSLGVLWSFSGVFIAVIAQAMLRKLPIEDCGCFGDLVSLKIHQTFFLDLGLFFLFSLLFRFRSLAFSWGLDRYLEKNSK